MRGNRQFLAFLALALGFIPLGSAGGEVADPIISKISEGLSLAGVSISGGTILSEVAMVDVLVHVDEPAPGYCRGELEAIGADVGYRFRFVDAYEAKVPASQLERLSTFEWVEHIEWNAPGKLDLEVSTATINTPQVWSSTIVDGTSSM